MKPIYRQTWKAVLVEHHTPTQLRLMDDSDRTLMIADCVTQETRVIVAAVAALPMAVMALLSIEWGSIAHSACPECGAKPLHGEVQGSGLTEAITGTVLTGPLVVGRFTQNARPRTPTGHHDDVECLIDKALTGLGYSTRDRRELERQKILSGG